MKNQSKTVENCMDDQDREIPNQPPAAQQPPVLDYRAPADDIDRHSAAEVVGLVIGSVGSLLFVSVGVVMLFASIRDRMWATGLVGALFLLVGIAPVKELGSQLFRRSRRGRWPVENVERNEV